MGIPRNRDFNGTMQAGVSYVRIVEWASGERGARLHPAMSRRRWYAPMPMRPSWCSGKRCLGVRYLKGGRNGTPVGCAREVILCGGAVSSPQLLRVSGIGRRRSWVSSASVKHPLAGVGENLRDHYAPRFVARVKNAETINEKSHGLRLVGGR